jgi:hypothetical protein
MTDKPSYTDASRPYLAPRLVRVASDTPNTATENQPQLLEAFRDAHAWVLLGEPGAGKSTAFKEEAKATKGGKYLSIADFVVDDDLDDDWREKTLFLDGLDEVRAGGDTLRNVRNKLKKLGKPAFRLSCRAADWYGATDQEVIEAAATDKKNTVLLLEPLSDGDILHILRDNHGIPNPENFVRDAQKRGIDGLLNNPQTLELLAKAVRGDKFPTTRQATYQLACEQLADENNAHYQVKQIDQPVDVESRLNAAGQLCAVLLLSNQTGITRLPTNVQPNFPCVRDFSPPNFAAANQVLSSTLFRPIDDKNLEPAHRTITEFLAARWLGRQIDQQGLPLKRVLNLLLGRDGRTVAGLRGLYAWLALACTTARTQLIQADPFTVVIYGDVSPMSIADKRMILQGLKQEAERFRSFRWQAQSDYPFGALAAKELIPDFIEALTSPDRSEAAQSFADCVVDILLEGEALPELAPTVKAVTLDATRRDDVRSYAMRTWLKLGAADADALGLLDDITNGKVADQNDDLAGALLHHLYPSFIPPEFLLQYVHPPKQSNHTLTFWEYELPTKVPPAHFPVLLDQLVQRTDLLSRDIHRSFLSRMIGQLLQRAIELHGEHILVEKLFAWLGAGVDKDGYIFLGNEEKSGIENWLATHPDRYKALLALCYQQCENLTEPFSCLINSTERLYHAAVPEDLGVWHIAQITQTNNETLAQDHLACAFQRLNQHGGKGLTLEVFEAWGVAYPKRQSWLDALLVCEIPERHTERGRRKQAYQQERAKIKRTNSENLNKDKAEIRSGLSGEMCNLAQLWLGHDWDAKGDTPIERFNNFCDNGDEILAVAEMGFRACVVQTDLPTVDEIIALPIPHQWHLPCLIGMNLRWQDDPLNIDALPNDTLCKMIAFQLTFPARNTPEWFAYLVSHTPQLVAKVLMSLAITRLNSEKNDVDCIYPLAREASYRAVAYLAVPELLENFPILTRANQLPHLRLLLAAARLYDMPELAAVVTQKTMLCDIDEAQKVYWLAAALLLNPVKDQDQLWEFIGNSSNKIKVLAGFVEEFHLSKLPEKVLGKFIELLTPELVKAQSWENNWFVRQGHYLSSLITHLGVLGTDQAAQELERLVQLPALSKLKFQLQAALHQLKLTQRERAFAFLSPAQVAQILANKAPASSADLAALALDYLDGIAAEIRGDNEEGVLAFWNVENKKPVSQREENLCRFDLMRRLRCKFNAQGITCEPEPHQANNKRADIGLLYVNKFKLPIEIKRNVNDALWTGLRTQLIEQYAIDPKADGYGIYLVLWFGSKDTQKANDGGEKPTSPEELKTRLEAQLNREERERIFIRVLDMTHPNQPV